MRFYVIVYKKKDLGKGKQKDIKIKLCFRLSQKYIILF